MKGVPHDAGTNPKKDSETHGPRDTLENEGLLV